MKIRYLISAIFSILYLPVNIIAQAPQVEWQQIIGHSGMQEYGRGADSTPDGGYAAGGSASWEGSMDCLIVKFNFVGDSVWSRTIGTQDETEGTNSFIVLPDGRYVSAGWHTEILEPTALTDTDALILITEANGDHNFCGYYGGDNQNEQAFAITQALDSNLVFSGVVRNDSTGSDLNIYKINYLDNCSGAPIWEYIYEEADEQIPYCVQPTLDGGYIVVGEDQHHGTTRDQGWFYKATNCGAPITMGSTDSEGRVVFKSVRQLSDSSYIITGLISYNYSNSNYDLILIKRDKSLAEVWTKTFGGEDTDEIGMSIDVTSDGGFIVGGYRQLDKRSRYDFWALRFDANGDTMWTKTVGTEENDILYSIAATDDGGYIMCGDTEEERGTYKYDMLVIKLKPDVVGIKENRSSYPLNAILFPNYPNPFNPHTLIKYQLHFPDFVELTVYDALGRKIRTLVSSKQQAGQYSVSFDGSGLTSGIYYYQLSTVFYKQTRKMILLK